MCDLSNLVTGLALVVSVASACFAGATVWVSREKLRLDLYNRRFDIYSRTLDFHKALHRRFQENFSDASQEELSNAKLVFMKAKRESQFLFPPKVFETLTQPYKADWEISASSDTPDKGSAQNAARLAEEYKKVDDLVSLVDQEVKPYLDFRSLSAWRWPRAR